jgi:hypothetical protein
MPAFLIQRQKRMRRILLQSVAILPYVYTFSKKTARIS